MNTLTRSGISIILVWEGFLSEFGCSVDMTQVLSVVPPSSGFREHLPTLYYRCYSSFIYSNVKTLILVTTYIE